MVIMQQMLGQTDSAVFNPFSRDPITISQGSLPNLKSFGSAAQS